MKVFLICCYAICCSVTAGCAGEKTLNDKMVAVQESNFQKHQEGAAQFGSLYDQGKKYRDEGRYKESIQVLEEAYNDMAYGKIEKAMALWQIALTYEAMKDYERAANFFEGAAKMTMNPKQAEEFNSKAASLRLKAPQNN